MIDDHETIPTDEHLATQVFMQDTHQLIEEVRRLNPEIEERPYQLDCLQALEQSRSEGRTRALVHMATGLGKTTVVATDVKRYLSNSPQSRVLFLCHQKEILHQARQRFESIIGTDTFTYGNFTGESKDMHDVTCLFASFQTMRSWKEFFREEEFDYIVVDESHHGKAETYEPILDYFKPDFMLGLTATPDRGDLQDIREIFGTEIFSLSLAESLARGYLARPDYRVVLDDIQSGSLPPGINSLRELNKTIFLPKRDEEIANIIRERMAEIANPRVIVFSPSIEHAEIISGLLDSFSPLHSRLRKGERRQLLDAFRNGESTGLVTVDMFNEGVDIPEANIIVFLRSTQSETIFLQQLGRGLRKLPGKESVLVLDFVANCDRLLMIEELLSDIKRHKNERPQAETDNSESDDTQDLYGIDFNPVNGVEDVELGDIRFSFNESSREILELIRRLQQLGVTPLPEGWTSVNKFAKTMAVTHYLVYKALEEEGIIPPVFTIGTVQAIGLSPDTQSRLSSRPEFQVEIAPEGWLSMNGLAKALGKSWSSIERVARKEGLLSEMKRYKFGPVIAPALSPEMQSIIAQIIAKTAIDDGYVRLDEYARKLNRSPTTIRSVLARHESIIEKKSVDGKHPVQVLSADQQQMLANLANNSDSDWVSLSKAANDLGIRKSLLHARMRKKSISTVGRSHRGSVRAGILQGDLDRIMKEDADLFAPKAPDGWKSISAFGRDILAAPPTIRKAIRVLDMTIGRYRFGPKIVDGLSPEQQDQLTNYLRPR